jgi:hypothetical protein
MRVTNKSARDRVLVLFRSEGQHVCSCILKPDSTWVARDVEILGTYKICQVTKLVDDPSVVEVSDE